MGTFSASSEACPTYSSSSLLLNQPAPPPNYSSTNFFLCLEGFKRLSGITRAAGGDPANSRARRLASPPAVIFLGLDLVLLLLIDGSCPDVSGAAHQPTISFAQSYGRGREVFDEIQYLGVNAHFVIRPGASLSDFAAGQHLPDESAADQDRL